MTTTSKTHSKCRHHPLRCRRGACGEAFFGAYQFAQARGSGKHRPERGRRPRSQRDCRCRCRFHPGALRPECRYRFRGAGGSGCARAAVLPHRPRAA
jgi:hypothetical protein